MKRIHIVGVSPRTGTTLMAEAIGTCFSVDYHSDHEERLFTRAPIDNKIVLTKDPGDIMVVGPSLHVDPNLYVICMWRDPRDIISSKHKKDPERYWASLRYWNLYRKEAEKLEKHPRFIPIRYEEFVSNPDKVQKSLLKQIPFLEQNIPFSRYHEAANVSLSSKEALSGVRPIKPTSVGKWKKHKRRVAGQLKLHQDITEDLIKYGYENDKSWLSELKDVEPDLSPSHFPEYMTFKKKRALKLGRYLEAFRRILEQLVDFRIRITHPKKWF